MRAAFLYKIVLITLAAVAVAYYAIATFDVSGIYSLSWTDADLIRHRCPIRLVQPEWVSSQPDTLMNWLAAEFRARLGVVASLWFGGMIVIVWRYLKKREDTNGA